MIRLLLTFCAAALLTTVDDKKSDGEVAVPEGKEFKLNKDEITVAKEADEDGRRTVTVKTAKAPTAVKMKAQKVMLGFYADTTKKDQLKIESVVETGSLENMRLEPKIPKQRGVWQADPGDIITHVNGFAVKTVEDLICAVHLAEDPADIQLIIKDVNDSMPYVFYVSAVRK